MVTEPRNTHGSGNTVPAPFSLRLARGGETAFGGNTAPMALEQESVLQKQSPWKCDKLELKPDPTV